MASNTPAKRSFDSSSASDAGPSEKKAKSDDFDASFEISSSLIDEMEELEQEEELLCSSNMPSLQTAKDVVRNSSIKTKQNWSRPSPPDIDPANDVISFQQIDIDHYQDRPIPGMPGLQSGQVPILRMYGVTMEGNSVCAHLHGFLPYFYVPLPCNQFKVEHCDDFRRSLNNAVLSDRRSKMDEPVAVVSIEICQRCSLYGFHFNKMYSFLKITMASPKLVAPARRIICLMEMGPFNTVSSQSYESNIEYEIRFMVDSGVVGCNWIDCPPGKN